MHFDGRRPAPAVARALRHVRGNSRARHAASAVLFLGLAWLAGCASADSEAPPPAGEGARAGAADGGGSAGTSPVGLGGTASLVGGAAAGTPAENGGALAGVGGVSGVAGSAGGAEVVAGSAGMAGSAGAGGKGGFQHPGIFDTRAELDYVKSKLEGNVEPYKGAYSKLKDALDLAYQPSPLVTISTQAESDLWMEDCNQAYNFALVWYHSGERRYAEKAIQILNAWSIFKKEWNDINTDWGAADLFAAAEIIRYSGAGWSNDDIAKLSSMTKTYLLPALFRKPQSDNRRTTKIRTAMAIYVFLDDKKGFEAEVKDWRGYTPVYCHDDGTSKETCRDINHVMYGNEGVLQGAQIAWNQGIDLYTEQKTALTNFLELYASWLNLDAPIPANICSSSSDYAQHPGVVWCTPASGAHNPPCKLEIQLLMDRPYNHFANRLKLNLPNTKKYNDRVRGAWPRMCLQDYETPL